MSSKILSLQGKGLKLDTRADIEPFLKDVDASLLEEIHLGGNTLGVEASQALGEFLAKATSLKVANFADIFTGRLISEIPLALGAICDALIDKTSLVEINLSDNAFGGRSVDPMIPFLTHNRSFSVLKLNNNGLGPAGGAAIADALLQSALLSKKEGKQSNLRTIICGRNRLENGSASAWAAAIAAHGLLEEVRMPQNGIRMEGIIALAGGLAKNANLGHLDLQDNTFSAGGSKAMAEALSSWANLHTLNFSDCVLSDDGEVPVLIETLMKGSNPKLRDLLLQNNNLEAKTFALLAQGIPSNLAALKSLELQWNDVDDDDENLQELADLLKARGGKLFVSDEDEEEDEEEEEEREEEEAKEEKESAAQPSLEEKKPAAIADKATDALADMLSKVEIR
ncbi:RNI-like protein [Gloeophyllum trabeum ATCC 11539]|uniref:RNI-like protein n=1 Tax=Gloeophyllum trabeum (strain ATCC 11539 / FP-39264 / Madison 617) TaxID=670483 RepID=S7RA12_GLOTA|nr:RNI-like protein [Gloeophyllum trabeum ATCC 11539]EPQ51090.1 RNI-like protein [Gloeophyllum trabeum ATCC 11539]